MDGNKRKQLNQALLAPDEEEEEVRYRNVLFYSPTKFCSSNSSNNSDANLLESSASRDLPRHWENGGDQKQAGPPQIRSKSIGVNVRESSRALQDTLA